MNADFGVFVTSPTLLDDVCRDICFPCVCVCLCVYESEIKTSKSGLSLLHHSSAHVSIGFHFCFSLSRQPVLWVGMRSIYSVHMSSVSLSLALSFPCAYFVLSLSLIVSPSLSLSSPPSLPDLSLHMDMPTILSLSEHTGSSASSSQHIATLLSIHRKPANHILAKAAHEYGR